MAKYTKGDFEHLKFIYARLLNVHGENNNFDYMIKFREIINRISINEELLEACKCLSANLSAVLTRPNNSETSKVARIAMNKAKQAIAKAEEGK